MKASRAQTCSIFGLTKHQFDAFVKRGMPATFSGNGRGGKWVVDTVEVTAWLAAHEIAAGRRAPAEPDPPPTPAGYEAVDALEIPFDQGAMLALLTVLYELPRQVAVIAADAGLPMAKV